MERSKEDFNSAIECLENAILGRDLLMRCGPPLQMQLVAALFGDTMSFGDDKVNVDLRSVLIELFHLENAVLETQTKKQTKFKRAPLDGLWHKHWTQAEFIPKNISLEIEKIFRTPGIALGEYERFNENKQSRDCFHPDDGGAIAKFFIEYLISRRRGQRDDQTVRMTGQWIVYEQTEAGNFYWTLAIHSEQDERIADRCKVSWRPRTP